MSNILYHATTTQNALKIQKDGFLEKRDIMGIFFANKPRYADAWVRMFAETNGYGEKVAWDTSLYPTTIIGVRKDLLRIKYNSNISHSHAAPWFPADLMAFHVDVERLDLKAVKAKFKESKFDYFLEAA